MAKRIEVIGSALVITDTITSFVEVDAPAKKAWYKESELVLNNIVEITYVKNRLQGLRRYPLADTVDENNTPYTVQSFKDFVHLNLGFDTTKPKV